MAKAMTRPITGKLKENCPDFPTGCDVCGRSRAQGNHQRCSKIRQERHAQILRNEAFDTMLMFDKRKGEP